MSDTAFSAFLALILAGSLVMCVVGPVDAEEGSAPSPPRHSTLHTVVFYPINRVLDLFDIFRLNVGFGPGYGMNVRATKVLQAGVENYSTLRFGLGKESGIWNPRYGIVYTESELLTAGVSLAYLGGRQRGMMEVGSTIHLGFIGVDAAIDLAELADFFLGWGVVDIQEDDH